MKHYHRLDEVKQSMEEKQHAILLLPESMSREVIVSLRDMIKRDADFAMEHEDVRYAMQEADVAEVSRLNMRKPGEKAIDGLIWIMLLLWSGMMWVYNHKKLAPYLHPVASLVYTVLYARTCAATEHYAEILWAIADSFGIGTILGFHFLVVTILFTSWW
ncbi:MAG: hypothetical protein MMC23_002891 [Stictis urceolatum]|nr:hypothetical protein [Stictis urceolata]